MCDEIASRGLTTGCRYEAQTLFHNPNNDNPVIQAIPPIPTQLFIFCSGKKVLIAQGQKTTAFG
jgi:hypothetical protein